MARTIALSDLSVHMLHAQVRPGIALATQDMPTGLRLTEMGAVWLRDQIRAGAVVAVSDDDESTELAPDEIAFQVDLDQIAD